ncbi:MAG: hypothetical protein COB98_08930 [Flavobacteriaceae bacterium]|nr:MAG: hypothetical protein COB98_08930 [Flavobacteriaceae bacterium]
MLQLTIKQGLKNTKKHLCILIVLFLVSLHVHGQTLIYDNDLNNNSTAAQGDLYKHNTSGVIYIGLSDGTYHPILINLQELLAQANDASDTKITNLGTPTDPKDAVTKQYVDALISNDNLYNKDGVLTADRILDAGSKNLTFDKLNTFTLNSKKTRLTSEGEIHLDAKTYTFISGPSGIISKHRVRINGMLSGDNWDGGTAGQILSSTGSNIQWIDRENYTLPTVVAKTSDYTLKLPDSGHVLTFDSNTPLTLTIPNGLPIGYNVSIYQLGTGMVSIIGNQTTIKQRLYRFKTAGQDAGVGIISTATDIFHLTGDLSD